jgi:hypothetical protein
VQDGGAAPLWRRQEPPQVTATPIFTHRSRNRKKPLR